MACSVAGALGLALPSDALGSDGNDGVKVGRPSDNGMGLTAPAAALLAGKAASGPPAGGRAPGEAACEVAEPAIDATERAGGGMIDPPASAAASTGGGPPRIPIGCGTAAGAGALPAAAGVCAALATAAPAGVGPVATAPFAKTLNAAAAAPGPAPVLAAAAAARPCARATDARSGACTSPKCGLHSASTRASHARTRGKRASTSA
mmetsp:Transcript_22432/g.66803  ORF Transcript_22432/g.66803 Transcript_22432/m.66803 type:complete len:206 (-) Transcript_22432:1274-1891(-)|eukprot:366278-Chlamydomonas_euryale.AAC.12